MTRRPGTKVERAYVAALAAMASRSGGMLIKEMRQVLAEELYGQLHEAVQRAVRDGLLEYDPERDGRGGARAYRLTLAGRAAASRAGEHTPGAPPPGFMSAPAPGSLGHAVLTLLDGSKDGMTCPEIITANGGTPSQGMLGLYGDRLRAALGLGYVTRHREYRTGARGRVRRAWVWQITDKGREALTVASSPRSEPAPKPVPKAEYTWTAGAARRYEEGESLRAVARSLGVSGDTVKRALQARGITVVRRSRPQPPWAREAARRYEAFEPLTTLASAYNVSMDRMSGILRREGVPPRDRKAARRMWRAAQGRAAPEIAKPAEPARAESSPTERLPEEDVGRSLE